MSHQNSNGVCKLNNFQAEKDLVKAFHRTLDQADEKAISDVFGQYCDQNIVWRAYHPFDALKGHQDIINQFWKPLKASLTSLQRREDVFFAGLNEMDQFQSVWVVSMGHLMGLFDASWLGIRPTHKIAMLRYCEFHRVTHGKIVETALYFDIPHLMVQAGHNPFPKQTAINLIQPGPMTHDGLLYGPHDPALGEATLALINKMIGELGNWQLGLPLEEELRLSWHEDMLWWGPTGIGATYTIERYAEQHSGPFRAAFSERSKTNHIARLAEGHYGGFFGWPNFTARLTGDFMGYPATDQMSEFRVIDIYRRAGNKLVENWIFIDIPYFLKQHGVDILPA